MATKRHFRSQFLWVNKDAQSYSDPVNDQMNSRSINQWIQRQRRARRPEKIRDHSLSELSEQLFDDWNSTPKAHGPKLRPLLSK